MSRAWWWIVVLLGGMIGGVVMWQHMHKSGGSYATFTSPHLKIRFEYPQGWNVHEQAKPVGRVAGEVQIFGPRREDLKYSPYVAVSAETAEGPTNLNRTLEDAVKTALGRRQKLPSYRVIDQEHERCAGKPAVRVLASYELSLPLEAANRTTVAFREYLVYCLRDAQLFRLTFAAPADDFKKHEHAFRHLVKTFTFLP